MSYATPLDMLERIGPDLLAQTATPAPHRVNVALMEAAIRGALVDYSADEQAIAAKVLTTLNRALSESSEITDFYLRKRHGTPLPFVPPLLIDLNVRMAFFKLFKTPSQERTEDFNRCIKLLQAESRGEGDLGISPAAPSGVGDVMVAGGFQGVDLCGYGQ